MEPRKANPKLHREMQVPHENLEAANTAWEAFFAEVEAARAKYRIPEVLVVSQINVMDSDEESTTIALATIGDRAYAVKLAAYAYGALSQEQSAILAKLAKNR